MYNFTIDIAAGYPKQNPYHNQHHIIDALQAMHYLMTVGDFEKILKMSKLDIFTLFVSIIIHDYEHPGFQN